MKSILRFSWLLFFVLIVTITASAQKLDFVSYSVEEGLSQSEARSVFQDSRGYLWVGTAGGGVCKFDGVTFTEYSHKQGLDGTIISSIAEDSSGNMWFGTSNAGVSRFDGRSFSRYDGKRGLADNNVTGVVAAKDRVLIGTVSGLYEFNMNTEVLRRITKLNVIQALHIDRTGVIWIGADSSLFTLNGDQAELVALPSGVSSLRITALGSDGSGLLYVGRDNGLMLYRKSTKTWSENNLTAMFGMMRISCITSDRSGGIWVGTTMNLVVRYDVSGKLFPYSRENGLLADQVHMIVEDDTRHVWMATTEQSLVKLRSEAFTYYHDKPGMGSYSVFRIFEDHSGTIWVGSNTDGLYRYDGKTSSPVLNGGVPFKQPVAICEDSMQRIWVGHYSGATCIVNGRPVKTVLNGMRVRALCADSKGNMWYGTWGNGLFKDDGKQITNYTVASGDLPQDYIHDIFEDSRGRMWFGTGAGLVKLESGQFNTFLTSEFCNTYVGSIKEDKLGAIWFHTDLCVMRYDDRGFTSYDQDDGLASNTVYLLEFDNEGRMWVGTNKGLDCVTLNGTSDFVSVRNFGKSEGFRGVECNSRAVCRTKAGQLWFGTIKGVISYDPANDVEDLAEPNIHLTGISLFLEKTDWTYSGAQQNGWYQLPSILELDHDHNHLTFRYEGINLQSPAGIRYRFMLVGFDSTWQPVTHETQITYSNLPPGEYVFKVTAGNGENEWNEEGAMSCRITIKKAPVPFWASWWFVLLVTAALAGGLYYIVVLRNRIAKRQRKLLEDEIAIRTQEISRQNEEKSLMLKEIHHRVKNNLQIISSLLNLHAETIQDPRVLSLFEDLRHRVKSMALIHEKMYQSKNLVNIDIAGYIDELIRTLIDTYDSNKNIRLVSDVNHIEFRMDTIVPLGLILSEIVSNSLKYAFEGKSEGEIEVSMKKIGPNLFALEVSDNGSGLPKDIDFEKTDSLGMLLIRMLSEQINGEITVRSALGTKYRLVFREEVKERF
ncbi:MAG: ATP-binding protein [Bacteroidia bacterium]|nr:ATP-binding protein [Bacteroidia bacterium]